MRDLDVLDEAEWIGVGANIRERRRSRRLTMMELAHRCDLSQPFLSQIENGRAKPSMDSLYRIARALATTPQALFGSPSASTSSPSLVRHDDAIGVALQDNSADSEVRLLLPGDAPFHVLEFEGLPTEFLDYWEHDGFEAIYALAGDIEIDVAGQICMLHQGDFYSYPARLPHRHRSSFGPDARALMIETTVAGVQDNRPSSHHPDPRHHTSVIHRHGEQTNQ